MATPKKVVRFDPQDLIDEQVNLIDEQLEEIERRLSPYKKHLEVKQQLLSARRALLGHGPRTTGGTSDRLHLEDILDYLGSHPGATPGQMAEHFSVTQNTVSSHLYRNKDRFLNKGGQYWVRDPKAGLNVVEDIPTEEDDEDDDD
jgi:DNA-binding transcriptional ArsR family regulator